MCKESQDDVLRYLTIFKCQVMPSAEAPIGDTNQLKSNRIKLNAGFSGNGENRSTRRKNLSVQCRNQQTQPACDVQSCGIGLETQWWEAIAHHHCANPASVRAADQLNHPFCSVPRSDDLVYLLDFETAVHFERFTFSTRSASNLGVCSIGRILKDELRPMIYFTGY